jgi:hypothetical protein
VLIDFDKFYHGCTSTSAVHAPSGEVGTDLPMYDRFPHTTIAVTKRFSRPYPNAYHTLFSLNNCKESKPLQKGNLMAGIPECETQRVTL